MSRLQLAPSIPANLIQQPIERTVLVVWLVAFIQFCNYGLSTTTLPSFAWLITAPILMCSSLFIAIRTQNSLPWIAAFLSGVVSVVNIISPDINSLMSMPDQETLPPVMLGLSVFSLLFWLLSQAFMASDYFIKLQRMVYPDAEELHIRNKLQALSYYLVFFSVNASVVMNLAYPGFMSQLNLLIAIVLLFVSSHWISATLRGMLLPVYVTMILLTQLVQHSFNEPLLAVQDSVFNRYSITVFGWAFILWLAHNFMADYYHRLVSAIKIKTAIWPWYGLLLLTLSTVTMAPESMMTPAYLVLFLAYLGLMLRNSGAWLISWSMVLLVSWIVLVVLSPLNPEVSTLRNLGIIGQYGLYSLFFILFLLGFNLLWERILQRWFTQLGWKTVSFLKPVLVVSLLIVFFWMLINMVMATGLISGWFDLIKEGLNIEMTTGLLLLVVLVLNVFMNNKLLANLVHLGIALLLVMLWGFNKAVPVYMLFALMHLFWVLLPVILSHLCARLSLGYPQQLVSTSVYWLYISFLATILSLVAMADSHHAGVDSVAFLSSIAILFIASVFLVRRYSYRLWVVFSYLLATGLILSFRFVLLGDVPVNIYDTAGIMLLSLLVTALNRYGYLPSPVISADTLVKLLPLSALFTLSWDSGSLHSSITLLLLGLIYLVFNREGRLSVYVGLVMINLAVYLWMPLLSDYTNLMLFYIIPVALSMLFITHLHRNEMQASLQNKLRFISLSLLYIVVAGDVFINETMFIFILGLLAGLASVIYGISSRTRAFLYTGVSFLVVIILGQLIVFYPEGRLGRALILMMTGAMITATMIWFNIKREKLLAQIRLFRADLDSWN